METLRQELFRKLSDLNEFVEANAKHLLADAKESQEKAETDTQVIHQDENLVERVEALSLLPVWLEAMQKSLQEFTEIARHFLPVNHGNVNFTFKIT